MDVTRMGARAFCARWRFATSSIGTQGGGKGTRIRDSFRWRSRSRCGSGEASDDVPGSSESLSECSVQSIRVDECKGGSKGRLDTFLADKLPEITRSGVQRSIKLGSVTVNGKVVNKPGQLIRSGDVIEFENVVNEQVVVQPEEIPLDIVYEDEHLLVVNKQAGLVVHPAAGNYNGTLVNGIMHHCSMQTLCIRPDEYQKLSGNQLGDTAVDGHDEDGQLYNYFEASSLPTQNTRPGIVHRLDKGTSGLMVVAKNSSTHEGLSQQFMDREVKRRYMAILCGVPTDVEGRIESFIGRDQKNRKKMAALPEGRPGGRHAASNFRVVEPLAKGGAALVEWRLETGRTHQIRVHSQLIGNPIVGDETYGGAGKAAVYQITRQAGASQLSCVRQIVACLTRPALHAWTLGFIHPQTKKELFFECDIPEDLQHALVSLRQIT